MTSQTCRVPSHGMVLLVFIWLSIARLIYLSAVEPDGAAMWFILVPWLVFPGIYFANEIISAYKKP